MGELQACTSFMLTCRNSLLKMGSTGLAGLVRFDAAVFCG